MGTLNKYLLSKSSLEVTIEAKYKPLNAQDKEMTLIASTAPSFYYIKSP